MPKSVDISQSHYHSSITSFKIKKNSKHGINRILLKNDTYFDKPTLYTRTPSKIEILNIVTIKNTFAD